MNQIIPQASISKPINFTGALKDFEEGQLCYVTARRYQGKGPVKILLHEAQPTPEGGFGYGHSRCWGLSPGSLIAHNRDTLKAQLASRLNGQKGGRPRKNIPASGFSKIIKSVSDIPNLTHHSKKPLFGGAFLKKK